MALSALLLAVAPAADAFEDIANSYCSTTTSRTCNVDADCPATETCMTSLGCVDGVDNDGDGFTDGGACSTTTSTTCQIDADCPATETCDATNADPDCVVEMYCQDGVDNDRDGSTDIADSDCQCLDDVFNAGNCTANDVQFVTIGLGVQDDGCVSVNDTISIFLGAALETTATTRYDIGMWIDLNGGDARGRTCSVTTTTSCTADADCPASEICAGICNRMTLLPTASPGSHDPFSGFCSVNTSTACSENADCPLFNLDANPPGEICEITAFRLEDTDKCGEISKNDVGSCSTTTTTPCKDNGDCPASETCVAKSDNRHANFIWPYAVTFPCAENSAPDGFVGLSRCSTWANSAGGLTCNSLADAGPETTSKCRCVDVPPTDIPLPEVSTSCTCDAPTTVPPGFPVTCTMSYSNAADVGTCSSTTTTACTTDADCPGSETCNVCVVDSGTTERFQCGTAGYLRFDLDDGTASGTLSGVCLDTGNCSVTTATSCTVDGDCPATETCVSKGQCSTTTTTSCSTAADCPATETCGLPTCDADSDCPNSGTCTVDGDLGTVETVGGSCSTATTTECTVDADCPATETCEISGGLHWTPQSSAGPSLGIVGPGDADSLTFVYTVDSGAGDGAINVTLTPKWVNGGSCSTTTSTSCQSDADCPATETCVPDYTDNPKDQTVIESSCAINVSATPVTVASLRAHDTGGLVVVEWETASEVGALGFHLWRRDAGAPQGWVRVNESLLPALQHAPGGTYRLEDPAASPHETLTYRLVEVDVGGVHRSSKLFHVEAEVAEGPALEGKPGSAFAAAAQAPSAEMRARLMASGEERRQAVSAKASGRAAAGDRAKVAVVASGIYRLDAAEIAGALGQPEPKTRNDIRDGRLRLRNRGLDVAWQATAGNAGILFYGEALDSPFTRENVYWLERGPGPRIALREGPSPAPAAGPQSFADTVHREQDLLGRPVVALDPLDDYWFWDGILTGVAPHDRKSFTLDVPGVAAAATNATLTVTLYGFTNPLLSVEHRAEVRVNGTAVGEVAGLGKGSRSGEVTFAQSLLLEGSNTVEVVGLAGQFFVDSFDVTYQRTYEAAGDRLVLRGDGHSVVTVTGLSEDDVLLYEISDPRRPVRVDDRLVDLAGGGSYRVTFSPASPGATYLVTTGGNVRGPASVRRDLPSDLLDGRRRADYVVLAPAHLSAAAEALADYRRSTGLEALVVDVEDVYDELNHGIADPRAIRDFLARAYGSWRRPPRYAVLAGKGSYDYRDLLGLGGNLVPPWMASTSDGLVAADNVFGDVVGDDGLPEIAVGRLPVLTAAELLAYVAKIGAYESSAGGSWTRDVLMVADNPDGAGDFAADSTDLTALLPPAWSAENVHLADPYTTAQARQLVLDGVRQGRVLVNYVGHGGLDRMATEGLLTTADVPALDNGERLPVLTALTCNLGMFAVPGFASFGETLVLHGPGGAAALWGPMGLSLNLQAVGMGDHLFEALFAADRPVLGDALLATLESFVKAGGDQDMLRIYGLLGDPALVMK